MNGYFMPKIAAHFHRWDKLNDWKSAHGQILTHTSQCYFHVEISQLICSVKQLIGFYMSVAFTWYGLRKVEIFTMNVHVIWTAWISYELSEKRSDWIRAVNVLPKIFEISKYLFRIHSNTYALRRYLTGP